MSPAALADTAASLGVSLALDGDRLAYDAPAGDPAVDALLARIAEHKEAVVAYLLERRRMGAVARRLAKAGVDPDLADDLSERVAIEIEFLSPLLTEGTRLIDVRMEPA